MSNYTELSQKTYSQAVKDEDLSLGKVTFSDNTEGLVAYKLYSVQCEQSKGVLLPARVSDSDQQVKCNLQLDPFFILSHGGSDDEVESYNTIVFEPYGTITKDIEEGNSLKTIFGCDFYNGNVSTLSKEGCPVTFSGNIILNGTSKDSTTTETIETSSHESEYSLAPTEPDYYTLNTNDKDIDKNVVKESRVTAAIIATICGIGLGFIIVGLCYLISVAKHKREEYLKRADYIKINGEFSIKQNDV